MNVEVKKWCFSLVGAVIGPFFSFTRVERYVNARWSIVALSEMCMTDSRVVMLTF